jgi:hypothetical protein
MCYQIKLDRTKQASQKWCHLDFGEPLIQAECVAITSQQSHLKPLGLGDGSPSMLLIQSSHLLKQSIINP